MKSLFSVVVSVIALSFVMFISTVAFAQQSEPNPEVVIFSQLESNGFTNVALPTGFSSMDLKSGYAGNLDLRDDYTNSSNSLSSEVTGDLLPVDEGSGSISCSSGSMSNFTSGIVLLTPVDNEKGLSTRPTFTWQDDASVDTYELQISTNSIFLSVFREVVGITSNEYTLTEAEALDYQGGYYWRARGLDSSGCEVFGWESTGFYFSTKPGPVTLVSPNDDANNVDVEHTFTWQQLNSIDKYDIEISTDPNFATTSVQERVIIDNGKSVGSIVTNSNGSFTPSTPLEYNTTYYWRVRGEDNAGTIGEWSVVSNFNTQVPPPAQVTVTSPDDGATGQPIRPTLDWNPVDYANWYYLEIYDNEASSGTAVYTKDEIFDPNRVIDKSVGDADINVDVAEFPFTIDADLNNAQTYYWQVRGKNNTGDGTFSVKRSFTTIWAAPGAVTLSSPGDGNANISLTPTLTWQLASNSTRYDLEVSTSSDFTNRDAIVYEQTGLMSEQKVAGISEVFEFTHEIPEGELDYDTEYYWRVRATNPDLEGDWTTPFNFRTQWPLPPQVTLISPDNGVTGLPILPTFSWDSMEYTSRYLLEIYTDPEMTTNLVYSNEQIWDPNSDAKSIGGSESNAERIETVSFTMPQDDALENATTYYWHVRGINSRGNGDFSTSRNFRTTWLEPGTVSLVSPISGVGNISLTPTLTWQEPSNWTAFDLEVSTSNDFTDRDAIVYTASDLESEKKGTGISDNPEYTHDIPESTLDYVTTYYWRVRAKNPDFDGAWSNPESFETLFPVPGNVTLVSPEANATAIPVLPTFTWNQVQYTWYYDLQVWNNNTEFGDPTYENTNIPGNELKSVASEVEDLGTREHTITTTLDNNSNYYWRIRARNNTGIGDWTDLRPFTTIWAAPATVTMVSPEDGATRQAIRPTLSWQYASNAVYYDVQIATTSDFGQDDIVYERTDLGGFAKSADEVNNGNFEHEVEENLDYSTTYYWRVKAKNPDLESDWNTAWSFETTFAPPIAPVLSAPDDAATAVSITPTLRWEYTSITSHYTVQVSTDIGFNNLLVNTEVNAFGYGKTVAENTDSDIESFNIEEPLSNNTTYYWRVQGRNSTGSGAWSETWSFTTVRPTPVQVTLVSPSDEATDVSIRPTLSWQYAANSTGFDLQVSTSLAFAGDGVYVYSREDINAPAKGAGMDDEHTILEHVVEEDLNNNTTYYWRVRGDNPDLAGEWSETRSFTTIWPVPDMVTELLTPENGATLVSIRPTFSWTNIVFAEEYELRVWDNELMSGNPAYTASGIIAANKSAGAEISNGVTVVHTAILDLANNTQYFWQVRAKNINDYGPWSALSEFTTIQPTPAQVTLVSPSNGATDVTRNPVLTWNEAENAVTYEFMMDISTEFDEENPQYVGVPEATGTQLNFGGTPLLANTTYYWRVRGVNVDLPGEWSEIWSFTTELGVPVQVSLLSPNNEETDVALLPVFKWSPLEQVLSYHLHVSTTQDFLNLVIDKTGIEQDTYTSEVKLAGQTKYFYRVRARNIQGYGEWSVVRPFTTTTDVPGIVYVLSPNNNEENVDFKPRFVWNRVDGASSYQLQVDDDVDFGSTVIDQKNIEGDEYMAAIFLRAQKKYYYRVRARNTVGYGDWSVVRPFTVKPATVPGIVRNIRVRQITTKQVVSKTHSVQSTAAFEISWTQPAFDGGTPIVDYRIVFRTADETNWTTYEREASTDTVAIVTGFESGVAYAFDVLAVNAVGAPEPTDDPPVVVSIETEEVPTEVTLVQNYPNPFNPATTIRFSLPVSSEVRLEVYSMLGQRLAVLVQGQQPAGWHTVTLDATSWASGTYIYRLQADGFTQTKKFLLVK